MPRRFLNRWLPKPGKIRSQTGMGFFGRLLDKRDLWQLNRRSTARAAAVGIFCSMIPVPFQMLVATAISIYIGCNVPIAVAMCWITNPLTMGPIFFGAYKVGAWILGMPAHAERFEISLDWLLTTFAGIWPPLVLGCALIGIAGAVFGFYGIHLAWRVAVVREWRSRRRSPRI